MYSKLPLAREVWDTPEYKEYMEAFHNNKQCQDWELKRRIKSAGINYKNYCCTYMAYYLIEDKGKKEINYDCVITHDKKRKAFGLPIHDGGSSYIKIDYCPWCGKQF